MLTYIYIESVTLGFKSTSSSILPCTSTILFHRASLSRYSITKNRHRSLQELFNRKGPQILQKHTTNPTLAPVWNHLSNSFSSSSLSSLRVGWSLWFSVSSLGQFCGSGGPQSTQFLIKSFASKLYSHASWNLFLFLLLLGSYLI